jgi:hypothetical protein
LTFVVPWKEETLEAELKIERPCKLCGNELPLSDWESKPIVRCSFCGTYNNNMEIIEAEPEQFAKIPDIKIRWVRFQERVKFATKPLTMLALGVKDSGKSCLLETLALRYCKIFDLYGAGDLESVCWCKPEFERIWFSIHGYKPRILFVTGDTKDVASKFETCHVSELSLKKFEEYDVITSVEQFFEREDEYFSAIAQIVNILWHRTYWKEIFCVIVREAANWLYARSKVVRDDKFAKSEFLKAMRTSRHAGLSLFADMLRWTSLDKEIRDLSDFTFIKCLGASGLPDDLHWLYGIFQPYCLMQMKARTFAVITSRGSVGMGVSDYPPWHKTEHENILQICGIEIKNRTEEVPKERTHTLGAFDHAQIVKVYFETKSMNQTAEKTNRSFKTVFNHIQKHNNDIRDLKECRECFNANTPFSKIAIIVPHAGRPKKEKAYKELNEK